MVSYPENQTGGQIEKFTFSDREKAPVVVELGEQLRSEVEVKARQNEIFHNISSRSVQVIHMLREQGIATEVTHAAQKEEFTVPKSFMTMRPGAH